MSKIVVAQIMMLLFVLFYTNILKDWKMEEKSSNGSILLKMMSDLLSN